MRLQRAYFLFFWCLICSELKAASCCGGGASFPSLILSDDKAQVGLSAQYAKVIGDAPSRGKPVFRGSSDDEWIHTYTLDAATLVSDRWQVGAAVPFVRKSRSTETDSASEWGFGDVSATTAFEFLPEYTYSIWKPRGFVFLKFTAPTGGNIYESKKLYAVDSRGTGLYTFSLGTFLIKSWGAWDGSFRLGINKPLDRSFDSPSGGKNRVRSGVEFNSALGFGYSPGQGDWRIGIFINPFITLTHDYAKTDQMKWTTSLDLSRIIARRWVMGLSYSDQTLLGPAKNTSLERGLMLFCRLKWER